MAGCCGVAISSLSWHLPGEKVIHRHSLAGLRFQFPDRAGFVHGHQPQPAERDPRRVYAIYLQSVAHFQAVSAAGGNLHRTSCYERRESR